MSNFCGTEIEIWAGFWPVDNTEIFFGLEQLFRAVFLISSWPKKIKIFLKNIVESALKSCIE